MSLPQPKVLYPALIEPEAGEVSILAQTRAIRAVLRETIARVDRLEADRGPIARGAGRGR